MAPGMALGVALAVVGMVMPGYTGLPMAHAQGTYWTTKDLLADFFQHSERVSFRRVDVDAAARSRIERRLGQALPAGRTQYTFFVAETHGHVDGYALFDEENGQHLPISFAVKLSPSGTVERHEIVAYRESHGDGVRDGRFRAQFVGKSSHDALRTGDDIIAVSGATISSRAMAVGVKRAIVLVEELILHAPQAGAHATASLR